MACYGDLDTLIDCDNNIHNPDTNLQLGCGLSPLDQVSLCLLSLLTEKDQCNHQVLGKMVSRRSTSNCLNFMARLPTGTFS